MNSPTRTDTITVSSNDRPPDFCWHPGRLPLGGLHLDPPAARTGSVGRILPPAGTWPRIIGSMHILCYRSGRNFEPKLHQLRLDPPLTPKSVLDGHLLDQGP
jgi:hypothetical protein